MVAWCVSVDTTVLHTFLSVPACTNIVYSKELERDVTATPMVKAHLRKRLSLMLWGSWRWAGVSVLVCTLGAAFEMDWWWFVHTVLSALACTAYTDMVYSKELERDLQLPRWHRRYCAWNIWHHSFIEHDRVDFLRPKKNKGCYVHAMYKMRLFWAKTGKTSAYFLRFDIKVKNSCSVFDLVTVLISKQSFFQHHNWPVYQGKSYLHWIALPDFYIVSPFFYKRSKQARVPIFVWLFRDVATTAKGPGCDEGTNLRCPDFAVVPLMPTRDLRAYIM